MLTTFAFTFSETSVCALENVIIEFWKFVKVRICSMWRLMGPNTNLTRDNKGCDTFLLSPLFSFQIKNRPSLIWKLGRQSPPIWPTADPSKWVLFHYVFMARLLCLMRSAEVCNLLGLHTNSIVEKRRSWRKSPRSGLLWAMEADKGRGLLAGGGAEDKRGEGPQCRVSSRRNHWVGRALQPLDSLFPALSPGPIFM